MPRRASCAASSVPDAPPPTIATAVWRSDFVVRPILRIGRAGFALLHMAVHPVDRLARRLGKEPRHHSMDKAGEARANQRGAYRNRSNAMAGPAHPKRARMLQEET